MACRFRAGIARLPYAGAFVDELMERITEAAELCLEVSGEIASNLEFVGVQRIAVEV
jgi:hypothetical protein